MSTPGNLYVTMQPRPGLASDQFHEWYNNEHGPNRLRLPHIFANGRRYRATDGLEPEFLASYDVKSMSLLESDIYMTLRANRTPREADTIGQVDVNRRFFDLVHTKQVADYTPVEDLSDEEAQGRVLVAIETVPVDTEDASEQLRRWYVEEHADVLAKIPGWLGSRLFKTSTLEKTGKHGYLSLQEFDAENGLGGEIDAASMKTPWAEELMSKHVASRTMRAYVISYIFGQGPRDLSSLSNLPSTAAFTSADSKTATTPGPDAVLTSYVTTPDDLNIPYRLEGNPAPDAPVVAFCNSLLTSLHMWDALVKILKEQRPDLKLLRYDFRGRNAIPQPPVAATEDTVADDLLFLLDALRISKLHALICVSMGGVTGVNFAVRNPTRLARLIACDFQPSSSAANTQAWKDRTALAEEDGGKGIKKLAEVTVARWFDPTVMENKEAVQRMEQMVEANNVEGFRYGNTVLWDYDLEQLMPTCSVPTLLVAGETDAKGAIAKRLEGVKAQMGLNGSELRLVANAGHLPMYEQPQGFWEAIREFL